MRGAASVSAECAQLQLVVVENRIIGHTILLNTWRERCERGLIGPLHETAARCMSCLFHPPRVSIGFHIHPRRPSEVSRDDHRTPAGGAFEHIPARDDRHVFVPAEITRNMGQRGLYGMVNHITGDDRILSLGRYDDRTMPRRMPGRRFQPYALDDDMAWIDQVGETSIKDRLDRVFVDRLGIIIALPRL